MTRIERLHKLIADIDVNADPELWYILRGGTEGYWDCERCDDKTLKSTLADIADQIERDQGGRVSRMRVLAVVTDMERHVSGVEGMEDSPVARWARVLREALGGDGRDTAADVSMSAYDLLPQEDRDAIAWVRYHGGRDEVRMELDNLRGAIKETCARLGVEHTGDLTADAQGIWRAIDRLKSLLGDSVPHERYEARRQRLLGHIAECEAALGRRREIISKLTHHVNAIANENVGLRRRAMPEGCEWPRYESGELVNLGDDVSRHGEDFEANAIALYRDGSFSLNFWAYSKGERVKRPEEVPAADGEPLEVGQTVYATHYGYVKCTVLAIEWVVDGYLVEVENEGGHKFRQTPDQLTHKRPDSWERLEEDVTLSVEKYRERYGIKKHDGMTWPQLVRDDLVRRAKALAERERGE